MTYLRIFLILIDLLLPLFVVAEEIPDSTCQDIGLSVESVTDNTPYRAISNSFVPTSINIDTNKVVGEINVVSGTTSTGAKTYSIPIETYPGKDEMSPKLSLDYNSQRGNSMVGIGWSLGGFSSITRGGKNVYYNNETEGVLLNNSDSFLLDGVRLIPINPETNYILYESETGNIKAKAYINGQVIKYFEVFYPDGKIGTYGSVSSNSNNLTYPLMSIADLYGNSIEYRYTLSDNIYRPITIQYNSGATVLLSYQTRPDPLVVYIAGKRCETTQLLSKISVRLNSTILRDYSLKYTNSPFGSLLSEIVLSAGGYSYNPVKLYYGHGKTGKEFSCDSIALPEKYVIQSNNSIRTLMGKFDYDSGEDGIAVYPNSNPYWERNYTSKDFKYTVKQYINNYSANQKIKIYPGINKKAFEIITEAGFIDLLSADLCGKQEENLIKVNNTIIDNKERVSFKVYELDNETGIKLRYTRTFDFATIFIDQNGFKSVHPKFYYTGDFDGDGKMEVMAVSIDKPFGSVAHKSQLYIFDIEANKILFQGTVCNYNVDFLGNLQLDSRVVTNNSDLLLPIDYNGDGKTDLCHIHDNGMEVYTFFNTDYGLTFKAVINNPTLTKSSLKNRDVIPGDFNGDGLIDIIVSSLCNSSDTSWSVFFSKGNGSFDKFGFVGPINYIATNPNSSNFKEETLGFIMHDVNGDGRGDLVAYDSKGFDVRLNLGSGISSESIRTNFSGGKFALIPTNINSRNRFIRLIQFKENSIVRYSYKVNALEESLLTGLINGLGKIDRNEYSFINDKGVTAGVFTRGQELEFPYVNIQEPVSVVSGNETYMYGKLIDSHCYEYENAVFHRQGLGFRGFEKICEINHRKQRHVTTFDPFNYSVIVNESSPIAVNSYDYSIEVKSDKRAKILLSKKIEKDILKGVICSTVYTYDTWGYPLTEVSQFSDGFKVSKTNTYASNNSLGKGYNLGFLKDQILKTERGGISFTERTLISSHSKRKPLLTTHYVNGNLVKTVKNVYDSVGNLLSEIIKPYSSTVSTTTSYSYDKLSRIIKKTDIYNLETSYSYNSYGNLFQVVDYRDGKTSYEYDSFGRCTLKSYPNGDKEKTSYSWTTEGTNGIWSVTTSMTGRPTVRAVYDACGRIVRQSDMRFNGIYRKVEYLYDTYGNLQRESYPYSTSAPLWKYYYYDQFDRLIKCSDQQVKLSTYTYSGLNVTSKEDNVAVTYTYDSQGNLVSVKDPAGTIVYSVAPDGQPISILAPGNVKIGFTYDKYRRRISMDDPSSGKTLWEYDASGRVSKQTDANGKEIQYQYDSCDRLIKSICPEFSTAHTFNEYNDLISSVSSNGTSVHYTYDKYGRVSKKKDSAPNGVSLTKVIKYENGNIGEISYLTGLKSPVKEKYNYKNGYLYEILLNDSIDIYKLISENSFGQVTEVTTGPLTRKYSFNSYMLPSRIQTTLGAKVIQDASYTFDINSFNLASRVDNKRNISEKFSYDGLNRLLNHGGNSLEYDAKGNILSRNEVGLFSYDVPNKPYAISNVSNPSSRISTMSQDVSYTSFCRPSKITEDNEIYTFTYNGAYDRAKMEIKVGNATPRYHFYLGNCYEANTEYRLLSLDEHSQKGVNAIETPISIQEEFFYLGGDYYDATAVFRRKGDSGSVYYILRDYLGSITHFLNKTGTLVQELSYDAWGALRDPDTHIVYDAGKEPFPFLYRGYTGHEHIKRIGLINMNARLFDPAIGRFLSPDPIIQMPDLSQNFNRYSYCLNNPLRYVDKNGEFFWTPIIIGAVVGGVTNFMAHWDDIHNTKGWNSLWKSLGYIGVGAAAGALGGAAGAGVASCMAHFIGGVSALSVSTTGILPGVTVGAVSGGVEGFIIGMGNSLMESSDRERALESGGQGALWGAVTGVLTGGIEGGRNAYRSGREIWTGEHKNLTLVQRAADYAELTVGGTGHVAGTRKHTCAQELLDRFQERYGYKGLEFKVKLTDSGSGRKWIPDVFDHKNKFIYDWKFGYPGKTPEMLNNTFQMMKYRELGRVPSIIIKPRL